jgi:hypothetical protein
VVKKKIEHHRLFGRHRRIFNGFQKDSDYLPLVILNGRWVFSSSPPSFPLPLPPPIYRCGILFYALFNFLEPTKEDPKPGAMRIHRTLDTTNNLFK